jgi:hypothetical protein
LNAVPISKMTTNIDFKFLLVAAAMTCTGAFGQSFDFKQWDTFDVPSAGETLPDGSTARLTQTTDFLNTNPGKAFSLGVFKSGSMHRVTLESLGLGGGSAAEELTFSVGYFVTYDWVQFHSHHIYNDDTTCHFYWSPTYDSSGNIKYGEMELYATVSPQTVGVRIRAHYYGQTANWVSPSGKTGISSYQLPLRQVIAAQTNYSNRSQNWVYLAGEQVYANDSPILTEATAPGFMSGSGFLQTSGFNAALASATPPTGSLAWKNAFVPRGGVSNGALVALGELAEADQQGTVAIGDFTSASGYGSVALGNYSFTAVAAYEATAVGGGRANDDYALAMVYGIANGYASFAAQGAQADGMTSIALGGLDFVYGDANHAEGDNSAAIGGVRNYATGIASFASGNWSHANSAYSVALGSMNLAPTGDPDAWVETDSLFELGNGIAASSASPPASARSNAITTLKNGRTTLTNKAWLAAVTADAEAALEDPAPTTDSGGEALVVDGHTRLRGKVVIEQPQGDIPMFTGN